MRKSLSIVVMLTVFCLASYAQERTGKIGFSTGVQNSQLDFLFPIWAANHLVVAPAFGFQVASEKGSDWALGADVRYYFLKDDVLPFVGIRGGALIYSPKNGDSVVDKLFGFSVGMEYFFHVRVSVGGEMQLNAVWSDKSSNRFGNPGNASINSGSALFATFYFN